MTMLRMLAALLAAAFALAAGAAQGELKNQWVEYTQVYSGTGHGFSAPKSKAEERANARSIDSTARTLKELFGI